MPPQKTVSLVLGSGGARGYAHIGVIEALLEKGYKIESISGASMGALVGAAFACDALTPFKNSVQALEASDAFGFLDLTLGQAGFLKGERLLQRISEVLPERKIEDLPIRYTAVATDILRQREVWFQKGSLRDAVRASIAIPTVFTPFKYGDTYLLDGGILNPIPISPTLADATDLTVAVNLSAGRRGLPLLREALPVKKTPNFWKKALTRVLKKPMIEPQDMEGTMPENVRDLGLLELWGLTVETMRSSLTRYKMAGQSPDIVIDIPRDAAGTYDFHRAFELIELGRRITRERIKDFEKACGAPDESDPPSSPN